MSRNLPDDIRARIDHKLGTIPSIERRNRRWLLGCLAAATDLESMIRIETTYHSCALEGITLAFGETEKVLRRLRTPPDIDPAEAIAVQRHNEGYELVQSLVGDPSFTGTLDHALIKKLQYTIFDHEDVMARGQYRDHDAIIVGRPEVTLCPPQDIYREMSRLCERYNAEEAQHPIEQAAGLHHRFVTIHPFSDGNGRTARLLLSMSLQMAGYPPVVIENENRKKYLDDIHQWQIRGQPEAFALHVAQGVERTLDRYRVALGLERDVTAISCKEAAAATGLDASMLRRSARTGRLAAHLRGKKGWFMTESAVEDYMANRRRQRPTSNRFVGEVLAVDGDRVLQDVRNVGVTIWSRKTLGVAVRAGDWLRVVNTSPPTAKVIARPVLYS
jgi:fido (protein-threonine AMPylation protein)